MLKRCCLASFVATTIVLVGVRCGQGGLIAAWHFNEAPSTPTASDSVGSAHGSLSGSADFISGGISGNAISIDSTGNGLVNMGNVFPLTGTDFSIVFWVKTGAGDTTANYIPLAKHRSGVAEGYFFGVNKNVDYYGEVGKAFFYQSNGSNTTTPVSTSNVNDGAWHQLIMVYSSASNAELYIDGVSEDSRPSESMLANDAPFLVGGVELGGNPTNFFNGYVDEVALYDYALSASDVTYFFEHPGATAVPEPSTLILALLGVIGIGLPAWRRRKNR